MGVVVTTGDSYMSSENTVLGKKTLPRLIISNYIRTKSVYLLACMTKRQDECLPSEADAGNDSAS